MFKKRNQLYVVLTFFSIFCAKMLISAAPVFLQHMDKDLINTVIMQVELEQGSDGDTGKTLKYIDYKIISHIYTAYVPIIFTFKINNEFLNHSKRYVNPYHPSVPTPPPNFC